MFVVFLTLINFAGFAQGDIEGSKDMPGISRFGKSKIIGYHDPIDKSFYYVIGPDMNTAPDVGSYKKGDASDLYQVTGTGTLLSYEHKTSNINAVINHYKKQVEGQGYKLYFECQTTKENPKNCGANMIAELYGGSGAKNINSKTKRLVKGRTVAYNNGYYACYIKGNSVFNLAIGLLTSGEGTVFAILDKVDARGKVKTKSEDYSLEILGMERYSGAFRRNAFNRDNAENYQYATQGGKKTISGNLVSTIYVNKTETDNAKVVFGFYEKQLMEDKKFKKIYGCAKCSSLLFEYYRRGGANRTQWFDGNYMYGFQNFANFSYGFYQKDGQNIILMSCWNENMKQTLTMIDVIGGKRSNNNSNTNDNNNTTGNNNSNGFIHISGDQSKASNEKSKYDLTYQNISYTTGRNGQAKSAVKFNGNAFIKVPKNINPNVMPNLTVSFWAKPEVDNRLTTLFSHDNGGYDRTIAIDNRGIRQWRWTVYAGSSQAVKEVIIDKSKWTFIAASFDKNSGKVLMCVDGKVYEIKGNPGMGLNYLHFGNNPTYKQGYFGLLDDMKIFDKSMTKQELIELSKQ